MFILYNVIQWLPSADEMKHSIALYMCLLMTDIKSDFYAPPSISIEFNALDNVHISISLEQLLFAVYNLMECKPLSIAHFNWFASYFACIDYML